MTSINTSGIEHISMLNWKTMKLVLKDIFTMINSHFPLISFKTVFIMNNRARPQISWVVLSKALLPLEHYFYSNLDAVKWQLLTKFCKQNFGKICFFGGEKMGENMKTDIAESWKVILCLLMGNYRFQLEKVNALV